MNNYISEQVRRDLNPHKPAKFAMWFFSNDYARQRLGSMGFWDSLPERDREMCRRAVAEIMAARDELPQEQTR